MYSADITVTGAGTGSGNFSLSIESGSSTGSLNASFSLVANADGQTYDISGTTSFAVLGGRQLRASSFPYENITVPAITISPTRTDPTRYTGSVAIPNLGTLNLSIQFGSDLTSDSDNDGTYDLFDTTPLGTVPSITVGTPPEGIAGRYYRFKASAAGPPIIFTATGLPAGLSMDSNGLITGRPMEPVTNNVTFDASNMAGNATPKSVDFKIKAATSVPVEVIGSITGGEDAPGQIKTKLWSGANDRVADVVVSIGGDDWDGVTTYSTTTSSLTLNAYTAYPSSTGDPGAQLPASISVPSMILRTSAGDPPNLTGMVRVGANNYTYTISIPLVGDLDGDGIYDLLDPTPRGETPVFTSSNRVVGGVGNSLAHTLTIRGYTNFSMFTFTAEPLPDGVSIDGNVISGTPTTVGTTTVALSAANPFGSVGRTNLILTILPGFTSSTAVQGLVNDASFRHTVTVTSNNFGSNLRFSATGLPTGTTISPAGVVSGKPTVAGIFPAVVSATYNGSSVVQNVIFTILGAVGGNFSVVFPTNTTNVLNLPAGMNFNRNTRSVSGIPLEWGEFELVGQLAGGVTITNTNRILPSVPLITSPTNLTVQVGQYARYQIVSGGAGREWSGYDGFNSSALSSNWTPSFRGTNWLTNGNASLALVDGALSFASSRTNEGARAAVLWAKQVPLYANWLAFARTRVQTPSAPNYFLQGEIIAIAASAPNIPTLNAKLVDASDEGRRIQGNYWTTNSPSTLVYEGGAQIIEGLADPAQAVWVGLRHDKKTDPTSLTSLGALPDSTDYTDLRVINPREVWGLRRTSTLTLAVSGMSDYAIVPRGTITLDDFTLIPDPEDIEYSAYLIGANGLALTNEEGNRYLPQGIDCDPAFGVMEGEVDAATVGGIYRIRLDATYKSNNLPVQEGQTPPLIRGSQTLTMVVLPAFTNSNSVLGYVNDANLRLQVGVSSNTFGNGLRFSASNLPTGMIINASNGLIGGKPTTAGRYASRITMTAAGASASQSVSFDIRGAAGGQFSIPVDSRPTNVSDLPVGLSYNKNTGVISGIPLAWGEFVAVGQLAGGVRTNIPISILPSVPVISHSTTLLARVGVATNWQMIAGGFGREWAGWDDFNAPTLSTNWSPSFKGTNWFSNSSASLQLINGELSFASSKTNDGARAAVIWAKSPPLYASWYAVARVHVENPGLTNFSLQGEMLAVATNLPNLPSLNSKLIRDANSVRFEGNYDRTNGETVYDGTDYATGVDQDGYIGFSYDPRTNPPALISYGGNLSDESPTQLQQIAPSALWGLKPTNRLALALSGMSDNYISPRGTIRLDDFRLLPDPEFIRYSAKMVNGDPLPEGVTVDETGGEILWNEITDVPGGFYDVRLAAEYTRNGSTSYDPPIRGTKDVRITVLPTLSADQEINLIKDSAVSNNLLTVGTHTFGAILKYRAEGLPDGLVLNTNTGLLSGRPTMNGIWRARMGLAVSNQTSFVPVSFSVLPSNGPLFAVGTSASYRYSFGAGFSNYISTNLPAGLNLNRTNGLITGIPLASGNIDINITAAGPNGSSATSAFSTRVFPSTPVITSPTNVLARVGQGFFYQIVAGGYGREWAGFDNFDSSNSGSKWAVATNVGGSSLVRTNGQLEYRPGGANSNYQSSYVYWTRPAPTHTSWLAYVDGWIDTNRPIPADQYAKAHLVAVQINGTNFNPATLPLVENFVHSKLLRDSEGSRQIGEVTIGDVPWSGDFSSPLDPADYQTFALRGGVSLAPSMGQLTFRSAGGTSNNQIGLVVPSLRLTLTRNWTIQLDAAIANGWSTPYSGIGFSVVKELAGAPNVTSANLAAWMSNRYNVKLGRESGGNYLGMHSYANGLEVLDSENMPVSGTQARLRLRYEADGMTLIAEGSEDGGTTYSELDRSSLDPAVPGSLGQRWGLSGASARLRLALWGETQNTGGTGSNSMTLDDLEVTIDPEKQSRNAQDWTTCAVGYDRESQEMVSYGFDYGAQQLVELVRTSVSDWGLTPSSTFVLVIGGHERWAGITQGEVGLDNFALIPAKGFTYAAENLPEGLSIDTTNGVISGVPTTSGSFDIRVTASGEGASHTVTVRIQISGAFAIMIPDTINTPVDGMFSQALVANIPGVVWSVGDLPDWLNFNESSGVLSGTPGEGDAGTNVIPVTGTLDLGNGKNFTVQKQIQIVVTDPGAPTLTLTKSNAPGLDASIQANVTGLPNGKNARFSLYWDANENGRVDTGEPTVFSYDVRNGGDYKVGSSSARNPIRPWDLDGAVNSGIRTELAEGRQAVWGGLVGKFVVQVSDPGATPSFRAGRAALNLDLPSKGQRVNGTLLNSSGEPLGGSVVVLQRLDTVTRYVVLTRPNGTWSAPLDPGDYSLEYHVLTPGNYDAPTAGQSTFTLAAGQNLTLDGTAEKVAISRILQGMAVDTTGNPLRGVILSARQGRSREALCFTDINGNFTLQLDPGIWTLQASGLSMGSLGLVARGSAQIPSYDLGASNQTGVNAVLAMPISSMVTGTLTTSDRRNLKGLSLSLDTDAFQADYQIEAGGKFFLGSLAGSQRVYLGSEDCSRLGVIAPEEDPEVNFPASGLKDIGSFTLDVGTLKVTARFVDLNAQPVTGMTIRLRRWGQRSGNTVAESQTRGGGYFAAWVKANENYSLTQYGPRERTPTHIFLPIPVLSQGPGTNALGDVLCYPLDEVVRVTPVNGADRSALTGNLLLRALAPTMWVTGDFIEDRGVLWGVRELVKNGKADPLRRNDTNTLSQIREVCGSQVIWGFFNSNNAVTNFPVALPGGVNTSISRSDWNSVSDWNSTNEAINLPLALELSVSSQNGAYYIPVSRKLQENPAAEQGLFFGFNYDGSEATRSQIMGEYNTWGTNNEVAHLIREVSTNRTIRVQYLNASGAPIPYRWVSYGIFDYNDLNRWDSHGVEYSGGAETDANGFVNLPGYDSWMDWRVTDWAASPQPEGRVRVVGALNTLVLRQYTTKTITGLGASSVVPGGTLRVNGSNLDQAGASWLGRVKLVPESENPNSPGQGIDLPVLSQSQSFMEVGIPGYLPNGRYKIRMDNGPANLYSAAFSVTGTAALNFAKLGSGKISFSSSNLVAGYGLWSAQFMLSNQATEFGQFWFRNTGATDRNTIIAEKNPWQQEIPEGTYGVWLYVYGLNTNGVQTPLGPFGTLNWP